MNELRCSTSFVTSCIVAMSNNLRLFIRIFDYEYLLINGLADLYFRILQKNV
jgi:hypothetical protein